MPTVNCHNIYIYITCSFSLSAIVYPVSWYLTWPMDHLYQQGTMNSITNSRPFARKLISISVWVIDTLDKVTALFSYATVIPTFLRHEKKWDRHNRQLHRSQNPWPQGRRKRSRAALVRRPEKREMNGKRLMST